MSGLGEAAIAYLRAGGSEMHYGEGAAILHRGEVGTAFHVILSGVVEVMFAAEDGRMLPLARFGTGEAFGEMSLLTGEPVSADVAAQSDVTLLVCPADRFQAGLAENAELRNYILRRLCDDLSRTSSKAWGFFQRAEALQALIHATDRAEPIVAESPRMQRVQTRIAELAGGLGPIWVSGPPGSGKVYAARKVHEAAGDGDAPLVIVDCPRAGQVEVGKLLFGPAEDRRFGGSEAGGVLQGFGALDLAHGGTLVLRHVEALDAQAQETLCRYLAALSDGGEGLLPRVRVIATTASDLEALVEADKVAPSLARALSSRTLEMPSLTDRKRDILPLAKLFLELRDQQIQDSVHRFDTSAENAVLSAEYRYRNAAELREAVELAALFAQGAEIGSEHIFTGPKDEGTPVAYDLTGTGPVRWLVRRGMTFLRVGLVALFLAIIAFCLLAPATPIGRIANALVWGLWWPALMMMFLLVGRAWCMVCPISWVGSAARRLGSLRLTPPDWVKQHSIWIVGVLFLLIVWSEHVFGMTRRPFATGLLLVTLMAAAAGFCLLFDRDVWCRYLCPLGSLGAGYSVSAMVRVRANPRVCAAQCRTHECFKGATGAPGCPMFHHPMYAREAYQCKLCLACLKVCPHDSAKLYVQPPLLGIWRLETLSDTLVPFAMAVFFFAMVMLASHKVPWVARPVPFTALMLLSIGLGAAGARALRWLLRGGRAPDAPAAVAPVAFALLLLAAGPLMAFHVENIPGLSQLRVETTPVSPAAAGPLWGVSALAVIQVTFILLSALFGAIALWGIRVRVARRALDVAPWRWAALGGVWAAYALGAAVLSLLEGVSP